MPSIFESVFISFSVAMISLHIIVSRDVPVLINPGYITCYINSKLLLVKWNHTHLITCGCVGDRIENKMSEFYQASLSEKPPEEKHIYSIKPLWEKRWDRLI